jgi:ABC-2 type transport system ATP-binding protein
VADTWAIETSELRKTYDGAEALRGLTFAVPPGSICGFLGRNGAGKTTTIKVLLGMARPTGGTARVFGLAADDPNASVQVRRRTGFVSEDKDLYDVMTVDQMVRFTASFYSRWRKDLASRYLRTFELPGERRVKDLSRGMRTRLALLLAFSRGADLLVLDEPTSGLDPAATEGVLQAIVSHVAAEGVTVFLSSHHLSDIDQVADHIVIIDRGRAVVSGGLEDLREAHRRIQLVFDAEAPQPMLRASGVLAIERRGRVLTILCRAGVEQVLAELSPLNAASTEVMPVTLKEIFLESVNGEN